MARSWELGVASRAQQCSPAPGEYRLSAGAMPSEVGVKIDLVTVARVQARHDAGLLVFAHALLKEVSLAPAPKACCHACEALRGRLDLWSEHERASDSSANVCARLVPGKLCPRSADTHVHHSAWTVKQLGQGPQGTFRLQHAFMPCVQLMACVTHKTCAQAERQFGAHWSEIISIQSKGLEAL